MSVPLPGSWIKPMKRPVSPAEKEKKPFELQEHLTTRPLRHDPELMGLKKRLQKGNKK